MNQQIINEIRNLKRNYQNNNNIYEIQYLKITEEIFMNKLKKITRHKWENITVEDNKEYANNGMTMNINQEGDIVCISKKMLKYKYLDNIKINLFNERKINSDNFGGSNIYEKEYKQKKMVFSKNGFDVVMIIKTTKMDKDVVSEYEMNIVFKSGNNEMMLNDIFQLI